jgi:membrane fusion protein, copper/silver efflux system
VADEHRSSGTDVHLPVLLYTALLRAKSMKRLHYAVIVFLIAAAFLAGVWYSRRGDSSSAANGGRKILYWHDPMHPAYKSDKPGIAPDCGMQLEPVYDGADNAAAGDLAKLSPPPGTVRISPEKQQLMGVKMGVVEKTSWTGMLRVPGRVAVDENRIQRIVTTSEGWIIQVVGATTGSIIQKDQLMGTLYSREFLGAEQGYIFSLNSLDRFKQSGNESPEQIAQATSQVRSNEDTLHGLGMSDIQIREIAKSRKATREIDIRSPMTGFVLSRNVSPNQRFDRATELYRLADLNCVWILADVIGRDANFIRPGMMAQATLVDGDRMYRAKVSDVPPQFDSVSRTLKIRLDVDNPQYTLRPDMFVDVEFPIKRSDVITVPTESVLDSGLHKTVFVDRGDGHFAPRQVKTGWRSGGRVEILEGLTQGDQIVVSGAFLMDSESRLQLAAADLPQDPAIDPVCRMGVDPRKPGTKKSVLAARTYYFCSDLCKEKFDKNPEFYRSRQF